jgi:predicted RecA/RadA family phage recombinase
MALNEIYKDGNELVFPVAGTVKSGDLVQVGEIIGVAQNDAVTGEDGETYATLKLNGVFELETDVEFAIGDNVYFDGTELTDDAADKFIGHAYKVTSTSVLVRLSSAPAGPAGPQGPAGE